MGTIILKKDSLKSQELKSVKRLLGIKNKDKISEIKLSTLPSSATEIVEVTKDPITGKLHQIPADSNKCLYCAEYTIIDSKTDKDMQTVGKQIPEIVFNSVLKFKK